MCFVSLQYPVTAASLGAAALVGRIGYFEVGARVACLVRGFGGGWGGGGPGGGGL